MTREEILGEALLRKPHPRYGLLTARKYYLLNEIGSKLLSADYTSEDIGIAWAICILNHDEDLIANLDKDDTSPLLDFWNEAGHVSDVVPFLEWFDKEFIAHTAAANEEVKDASRGKPEEEKESAPTG